MDSVLITRNDALMMAGPIYTYITFRQFIGWVVCFIFLQFVGSFSLSFRAR
jgi:hypothetical protein